jgi:hypothetical protein
MNCVLFADGFGISVQSTMEMSIKSDNCLRSKDRGRESDCAKSKESHQRLRSPL